LDDAKDKACNMLFIDILTSTVVSPSEALCAKPAALVGPIITCCQCSKVFALTLDHHDEKGVREIGSAPGMVRRLPLAKSGQRRAGSVSQATGTAALKQLENWRGCLSVLGQASVNAGEQWARLVEDS
jgi:hypothetical protein